MLGSHNEEDVVNRTRVGDVGARLRPRRASRGLCRLVLDCVRGRRRRDVHRLLLGEYRCDCRGREGYEYEQEVGVRRALRAIRSSVLRNSRILRRSSECWLPRTGWSDSSLYHRSIHRLSSSSLGGCPTGLLPIHCWRPETETDRVLRASVIVVGFAIAECPECHGAVFLERLAQRNLVVLEVLLVRVASH